MIAGGGIGDGPIDGVVNFYVIDNDTRSPIRDATVRVGTLDGTTDADGLFVAEGLVGPQTVGAKATSYRSEVWVGVNGANVTVALRKSVDPTPQSATLTGTILGFDQIVPAAGHRKTALVAYSQDDRATDAANNLATANSTNICDTGVATQGCTFAITTRTGKLALIAAIFDHDTKGDTNPQNDTFTLTGWAYRTGISVQSGATLSGQDLTLLTAGNLANVSIDFGSPPSGLPNVAAFAGIDLGADGVLALSPLTPAMNSLLAPKATAFTNATYRLTGFATNGTDPATSAGSFVIGRGLAGPQLVAPTWLPPVSGFSATRTGGSWSAVSGAKVQGIDYEQGTAPSLTHLLSLTVFDGSTSFTIPDFVALPTSGALTVRATAIAGNVDLENLQLDTDFSKITSASSQPMSIN